MNPYIKKIVELHKIHKAIENNGSGGDGGGGDTPTPEPTPAQDISIKFKISDFGLDNRDSVPDELKNRGYDLNEIFDMSDDTLQRMIDRALRTQAKMIEDFGDTPYTFNFFDKFTLDLYESGTWSEFTNSGAHPIVDIQVGDYDWNNNEYTPIVKLSFYNAFCVDISAVGPRFEMQLHLDDNKYWFVS